MYSLSRSARNESIRLGSLAIRSGTDVTRNYFRSGRVSAMGLLDQLGLIEEFSSSAGRALRRKNDDGCSEERRLTADPTMQPRIAHTRMYIFFCVSDSPFFSVRSGKCLRSIVGIDCSEVDRELYEFQRWCATRNSFVRSIASARLGVSDIHLLAVDRTKRERERERLGPREERDG